MIILTMQIISVKSVLFSAKSSNFVPKYMNMVDEKDIFQRSELLLGAEAMERLAQKRVIVFGVGGVGSWLLPRPWGR